MNSNIDLTKILKDCPMGWRFYSSVYGDVEFIEIYRKPVLCNPRPREDEWLGQEIHDSQHPILFDADGFEHRVSSRGEMIKGRGECTFFPSREQRDWDKFTAPWYKKESEHKFHEGDWVVYNNDIYQIVKREEGCNKLVTVFGIEKELVNERNLSTARLWTIQDAKDGDIIQFGTVTAIFKKYIGREKCICYCSFCKDGGFEIPMEDGEDNVYGCYNATPATKEQRDVLIKAMNDAGYKWNGVIKTLEKLVKPNFKVGDRVRHKDTNKDDVYEISKVYDDSYGIAGFNWMILMKYQDQYELVSNKFDPKTLRPFDKVLVRDNWEEWYCSFFSHIIKNSEYPYKVSGPAYQKCIPYNDDTKHLVGITDEAPEYYRYWED